MLITTLLVISAIQFSDAEPNVKVKKPDTSVYETTSHPDLQQIPNTALSLPSDFVCTLTTEVVEENGKDIVKLNAQVKNCGKGNYKGKPIMAVFHRYTCYPPKTYNQCADLHYMFTQKIGTELMSGMTLMFETSDEIPGFLRMGISPQNENEKGALAYYALTVFPEDKLENGEVILGHFTPREDSISENTAFRAEQFRFTVQLD